MKHIFLLFTFVILTIGMTFAQMPQGFNYQAVLRDDAGALMKNQDIKVKIGILEGGSAGTLIWEEEHTVTTNDLGLMTLRVGDPDAAFVSGTVSSFGDIDWSAGDYYLQVSVDLQDGNGYHSMGEAALLPVPFAMYAQNVADKDDADADPQNEIQDLQLNGNLLSLTKNGNPTVIDLGNYIDDADADPQNELQDLHLEGNILTITGRSGATQIDLSTYLDNPGWHLSLIHI